MRIELIEHEGDLPEGLARSLTPEEVQARKMFHLNQMSDLSNVRMRQNRMVLRHITQLPKAPNEYYEFWIVSEEDLLATPL
jgi:hypothetical protein